MQSARLVLAGTLIAAFHLAACRSQRPARPVIAVAYPLWSVAYVELAESTLARTWGDTAATPRFLYDVDSPNEVMERVVAFTQEALQLPGVTAVVGPSSSRTAVAVAPMVDRKGIPQIIPTSTSRLLHQAGPWIFRLVPDDSVEGEFLVHQVLARRGLRRVLVLYTNDEYGQGLRAGVHEALTRSGLAPTAEIPVSAGSDFDLLVRNELTSRPPDAIVAAIRNVEMVPLATVLKRLRSRIPVFAGDGAFSPFLLHSTIGTAPFEIHAVAFWLPAEADSVGRDFMARFLARTDRRARPEDALAYDALVLAAHAVREGRGDPQEARRWLLSLGVSRPPFAGAAGPISFAPGGARKLMLARFVGDTSIRSDLP
jgi:ABC-type branched-subunit amino acid transport system substrate-binding protein